MVESRSVRAAEMVGTLSAVNRWCVSGTPIQKDLRGTVATAAYISWANQD